MAPYGQQVFLNVPFDVRYKKLLHALVFAIHECGPVACCASEREDNAEVRVEKLYNLIRNSRFGIHDLSRTTLDREYRLPRFNMPLELGLFLGARPIWRRRPPEQVLPHSRSRPLPVPDLLFGYRRPKHTGTWKRRRQSVDRCTELASDQPVSIPSPAESIYTQGSLPRVSTAVAPDVPVGEDEAIRADVSRLQQLVVAWITVNPA